MRTSKAALLVIAAAFAAVLTCGCYPGLKYKDQPEMVDIAVNQVEGKTRVIPDASEWRNSGVLVRKGVRYSVQATGQWRTASHLPWTNAEGTSGYRTPSTFVDGFPGNGLVGRIGETGAPFAVGTSLEFVASADGVLFFRINKPSLIAPGEGALDVAVTAKQRLGSPVVAQLGQPPQAPQPFVQSVETSSPIVAPVLKVAPPVVPTSTLVTKTVGKRFALIIGNSAYRSSPLKNPANDAQDMATAMRRLGFEVTLLKDATLPQMEGAVREFGLKLRQGGTGLFYYAGHGVQVAGENYLVPVNAVIETEGDVKYGCLPAGLVLAKMEDARNDVNIIILDACRNNPFTRSFRGAEQGLAKMDAPTGSIISYATAPGSVASDGTGRNGLFTQYLLKNLATPGLPITEVFMRVRQGVVQETQKKQVPWETSSLIGQFYFNNQ